MLDSSLGVVVLAYGAGGEHGPLLDSLAAEGLSPERIVLVHNPSQPGQASPRAPAGCEVIAAGSNLGYAAGMNLGIERQRARGCQLLLLLTHDARLWSGALAELVAAADAEPGYGALGPALVFTGTEAPFSFGGTTRRDGTVRHRTTAPPPGTRVAPCDWIDGGTMLIRTAALERTDGFDERFWAYWEDADLCLRIERAGFGVGVAVEARADQAPGGAKRPGAWAYLLTRNGIAYAQRFAGTAGVASTMVKAGWQVLLNLARSAVRAGGLRPGPAAETWAIAVGTLRGALDFAVGRWGPPPTGLPGMGDLSNVQASHSTGAAGAG